MEGTEGFSSLSLNPLYPKGNDLSKPTLVDIVLLLITFEVLFLWKYSAHIIKFKGNNDPVNIYFCCVLRKCT